MTLLIAFLVGLYFVVLPIALHEFGHWLVLKYYHIPFKFFFNWKGMLFGFIHPDKTPNALKASLGGAFPPLLILIPLIFVGDLTLFGLGSLTCLILAMWTVIETWKNLHKIDMYGRR